MHLLFTSSSFIGIQKDDCTKKKKKNNESITYSNKDNLPKF